MLPLAELLGWIGAASGLQTDVRIYALTSTAHVLGLALLVGGIIPVGLSMGGVLASLDRTAITTLRRFAAFGLALCVVSGVLLLSAKPVEYLSNPVVLFKLAAVAAAIIHAIAFHVVRAMRGVSVDKGAASGAISICLWLTALALGRWIAFSS